MKKNNFYSQINGKKHLAKVGYRAYIKKHRFGYRLIAKNLPYGLPIVFFMKDSEIQYKTWFKCGKRRFEVIK